MSIFSPVNKNRKQVTQKVTDRYPCNTPNFFKFYGDLFKELSNDLKNVPKNIEKANELERKLKIEKEREKRKAGEEKRRNLVEQEKKYKEYLVSYNEFNDYFKAKDKEKEVKNRYDSKIELQDREIDRLKFIREVEESKLRILRNQKEKLNELSKPLTISQVGEDYLVAIRTATKKLDVEQRKEFLKKRGFSICSTERNGRKYFKGFKKVEGFVRSVYIG